MYDDKSALEQMHCTLLIQLMMRFGLDHLISPASDHHESPSSAEAAAEFKKLLMRTVLITDMSLHFQWIGQLSGIADTVLADPELGSAGLDDKIAQVMAAACPEDGGRLMICQALIKCGDISNPVSPFSSLVR